MTVLMDDGERYAMLVNSTKYLLFLPLVQGHSFEVTPRLAISWEHAGDFRTWTVHLREGVRWHDGFPVTAHDIVFSIELFSHPDVLFPPCGAGLVSRYDSIWAPDDHTLMLSLERPTMPPPVGRPVGGCTVYLPRHLLEDLDPAEFFEWEFWHHPVGNGPYRFARRVPQTMLEFEANPDFYAGMPSIPRVVVKVRGNPLIELRSGGADVALIVGPTDVLKLAGDPRFTLHHTYDWSELVAIHWNQRHPLLADAVVRRALSHAIDRRQLARLLNYPEQMPLVGGVSNEDLHDHPYTRAGWDQGPCFDLGRAQRLLSQAGWVDEDRNGVRERAGQEARFTLTVISEGDHRGREQGLFIQDQLRRVGVALDLRPMELAAAKEALRRGDFEAIINLVNNTPSGILGDWMALPPPWEPKRGSERPPPFGYRNQEAARLLREVYRAPDLEAQDSLYRRINAILRRDMPVTFLFPVVEPHFTHRRIRGFRPGGLLLDFPEELWIEDEP